MSCTKMFADPPVHVGVRATFTIEGGPEVPIHRIKSTGAVADDDGRLRSFTITALDLHAAAQLPEGTVGTLEERFIDAKTKEDFIVPTPGRLRVASSLPNREERGFAYAVITLVPVRESK